MTSNTRTIRILDDFLSADDLKAFQAYVAARPETQEIIEDRTFATRFWATYHDKFPVAVTRILPRVTVTRSTRPVGRHIDHRFEGERYKLLIYLNAFPEHSGGGTIFHTTPEPTLVPHRLNRLVCFDISLPHESEPFPEGMTKCALGFRLKG